jgi:hypothetical protein
MFSIDLASYMRGLAALGEAWFERYRQLEGELEGKWFALSADGEVLAVTDSMSGCGRRFMRSWEVWNKGGYYSPTKEERKVACLFC